MKGGLTFYRGSGKEARNYIEADHHKPGRADEYYLAEGQGIAQMTRIRAGETVAVVNMDGDTYERWVEGQDVTTGLDKGHVIKGGEQRKALRFCEVNINCPKSLSLVAAIHPDISHALDAAQLASAEQINQVLAKNVTTRVGPQGAQVQVHVEEIEVVSVAHQTSRAGDPHRHIHHQINARVLAGGKYRGLDSKAMLRMTRMLNGVGERAILAHPELRHRLAAHGYTLTDKGEVAQLAPYVAAMSKRSTQVTNNIARYERDWRKQNPGVEPGSALRQDWKRAAWNDGRQAKNKRRLAMPGELVDQEWRTELRGLGVDIEALQSAPAVAIQGPTPGEVEREAVAARALAVLGTGANGRSAWNVYDVRGAVEETLARRLVHGEQAVLSSLAEDITGQVLQQCVTTDPTSRVAFPDHVRHLTSPAVIALEQDITGRLAGRSIEGHQPYRGAVPDGLDAGQAAAVRAIAGTGQLVQIEGAAGVGKTRMLAAANEVLTEQGRTLRVFAPSKKAAIVAAAEIGASEANTVHGLVYGHGFRWDTDGVWTRLQPGDVDPMTGRTYDGPSAETALSPRDVVVVDESGMADQEAVRALLVVLDEAPAVVSVVFVGDRQQLAPVGRGGSMDFVHAWAPAYVEMDTVHRFRAREELPNGALVEIVDRQYAELSLRMRAGQEPEKVFDELAAAGRVVVHQTEDQAVQHLAAQVADKPNVSRTVAVSTNAAAEAINLEVRTRLVAAGMVDDVQTVNGADGIRIGRGDRVQTRSNDRDLGVMNRECWEVISVRTDGTVRLRNEQDRSRFSEVDASYCRENVQHNYAGTVHSVQGATVDRAAMLLTGRGDGAGAYVGLTRGKFSNTLHVVAPSLAEAREIWVETTLRERQDTGLAQAAQAAKVESSAYAQRPPLAQRLDKLMERLKESRQLLEEAMPPSPVDHLVQREQELLRDLAAAQRAAALLTDPEQPVSAVLTAQQSLDQRMARAQQAAAAHDEVYALNRQVQNLRQEVSRNETQLAQCGRFAGGRKRELTALIERGRAAQASARAELQAAQDRAGAFSNADTLRRVEADRPNVLAAAQAKDDAVLARPGQIERNLEITRRQLATAKTEHQPDLVPQPSVTPRPSRYVNYDRGYSPDTRGPSIGL
jgi:exodeoxyribonuclease V alpha subunit